jgi:hypothetical protein
MSDHPIIVLQVSISGGKYIIEQNSSGALRCLRYGEPWRDLTGDGMVCAMAHRIELLESELRRIDKSNPALKT